MTPRNERRLEKKRAAKRTTPPRVEHSLPPGKIEMFRLEDDGTGRPMYFNITALKRWVSNNVEEKPLIIEQDRAKRLVESGAVDEKHVENHTLRHKPDPLILCRSVMGPGEDHIVDGAHRYVAAAQAIAFAGRTNENIGFPAYDLAPHQWRPFVIPLEVVAGMRLSG